MKFFYENENDFVEIGEVKDIDLTCDEAECERLFNPEPIELKGEIQGDMEDLLNRIVLGQGRYNAMRLKKDGFLSPKNGWIT